MRSPTGIICVLLLATVIGNAQVSLPQVNTAQGTVVGSVAENGGHFEFYGIPYADSTAGIHRFKAPLPPPIFTAPFTASRKNIKCVRPLGVGFEGTEDCLVANVFTPSLSATSKLPVMVWIQGSEFSRADVNELSFRNFVEQEVVVVSLNFRESIFGFLCLGTETAPGNAGLKDIIAGLRWVQQNIANFGGNPDDVTLFGHGTGAAAVDLVTLSPMAEGLVHKAISQSGSALAPWAVSRDNLASALLVAEALGHNDIQTIEELSEVFTRISVPALMAVINDFDLTDNSLVFAPCVERSVADVEPFLMNTPFEIISEGNFLQIPFMTGFVDNEGTIRADKIDDSNWLSQMEEYFSNFLQADLAFNTDAERTQVADEVMRYYFEDNPIIQSIPQSLAYHGDTMVLVSAIREARLRVTSSSTAPVYLYQFSYKGNLGRPFVGPIDVDSAAHSEELAYLFHDVPLIIETNEISDRDITVAEILVERWTNFAKNGNPTSEISQIDWQPFTLQNPNYLRILNNVEITEETSSTIDINLQNPHPEVITFWESIYEEHFLDAQSSWDITIRDEDEEIETGSGDDVTTTTAPDELEVTTPGGEPDATTPGGEDGEDAEGEDDGQPDSASTAVGYTFVIISLFALLDKFHSSQIMS